MITRKLKGISGGLVLCCLLPGISSAGYTVLGPGSKSCDVWVADRESFVWVSDVIWLTGWVSAAKVYGAADLKQTSSDAIAMYVDKYCQENPHSGVSDAAAALVDTLKQR